MPSILSFDIDLNRVHAYSNDYGVICENSPDIPYGSLQCHQTVLIEVASANFYGSKPGEIYNRVKWVIFNSMMAGRIYQHCMQMTDCPIVLVAPSSSWTCGYPEALRHSLAGVTGSHDIKECKAMQFFYGTNPGKWQAFEAYFASLSKAKRLKT